MLEANALSVSMGANRNLKLPRFPALIDDLILIKHSDRALVGLGTHVPRLIEGKSISTLVDHLFPLLDGSSTFEQICGRVSKLAPASVADAMYFLFAEGLLIEGGGQPVCRQPGTIAFFDRYCGIKGNLVNGRECTQQLATTKALVLSGQQNEAIASILQSAGLEDIAILDITTLIAGDSSLAANSLPVQSIHCDADMGILFIAASDLGGLDTVALAKAVRRMKRPVLFLDPQSLSIGPLILSGESGCLQCAISHMPTMPQENPPGIEAEYAHAMMSARIAMFVGEIVDASLFESLLQIDCETMQWRVTSVYRQPGCPGCAPSASVATASGASMNGCDRLIEFFHLNTQDNATSASKTSHLLSYSPKVISAVTGAYKKYPLNSRSGTLHAGAESAEPSILPERLVQMIGAIACWSHAIGDGVNAMSVRATPSAGNLSSQNVYLLSGDWRERLPMGVHYCHPDGSLVLVSDSDRRDVVANAVLHYGLDLEAPETTRDLGALEYLYIVGTSTLARLESKYQRKAYRFALQDAGVLVYGLLAAAASIGIKANYSANFFDDQIAETLKISNAIEIATFVVRLELDSNHDRTDT